MWNKRLPSNKRPSSSLLVLCPKRLELLGCKVVSSVKRSPVIIPVTAYYLVYSCNKLQNTSKCGKNISDTLRYRFVCHVFVLSTFWRHLWSITEQTHGNMESICWIETRFLTNQHAYFLSTVIYYVIITDTAYYLVYSCITKPQVEGNLMISRTRKEKANATSSQLQALQPRTGTPRGTRGGCS